MFEALFEFAPQGMVLINGMGQIVLANVQAQSLFGYEQAELQHQSIALLLPTYHHQWYANPRLTDPNSSYPRPYSLELQGRAKDGGEFPLEISFSFLSLDNEFQTLATLVEISQRKQTMAETKELYHHLFDRYAAERLQIAQKLHRGPLQDLQSLNFALSAFVRMPELQPDIGNELTQIRVVIQQIARQLRALEEEFGPPILESFGLAAAIESRVNTLQSAQPNLKVHLDLAADAMRLSPPVRNALFYACEQALLNVVQHANAQQVQIRLALDGNWVQLAIIDDGCGFAVPLHWITIVREQRLGLVAVTERIEAVGGFCQIASLPGQGTTICATAPVVLEAYI